MKTIRLKRDSQEFEIPIIYFQENQSISSNRDSFGNVYSGINEYITILVKPNIDIKKGDIIIYNDFEVDVASVITIQYNGKNFLKKVVAML